MKGYSITTYNKEEDFSTYPKRKIFNDIIKILDDKDDNNLIILYGLRSTGKSTILGQILSYYKSDSIIKIKIESQDIFSSDLNYDIKILINEGKKYFIIDEITKIYDFSAILESLLSLASEYNVRFILSGTDSLNFSLRKYDLLIERAYFINTTYIPYTEWREIIKYSIDKNVNIDDYIKSFGLLDKLNLNSIIFSKNYKYDIDKIEEYINTAIVRNLFNSLSRDFIEHQEELKEIYYEGKLLHVVANVIRDDSHKFIHEINNRYNHKDVSDMLSFLPIYSDKKDTIKQNLNKNLSLLKDGIKPPLNNGIINIIKVYLFDIEIFKTYKILIFDGKTIPNSNILNLELKKDENNILTQPGIRYTYINATLNEIKKYGKITDEEKNLMYSSCVGALFEECILYNTIYELENYDVFKLKFRVDGKWIAEFDMIIYDKNNHYVEIYEIKHGKNLKPDFTKNFANNIFIECIEKQLGKIKSKNIIYNGNDDYNHVHKSKNEQAIVINYINVNTFFNMIKRYKEKY